jgi:hypothetical protein
VAHSSKHTRDLTKSMSAAVLSWETRHTRSSRAIAKSKGLRMWKVEERVSLLPKLNTVNAVAGAVLFVCPWVLSYEGYLLASINAWIGGLALTVLAVAAATDIWPKLNLACLSTGVWIFAAPWLLDFSNNADPATSHLAAGAIAILVSLVCLGGRWITRPHQ